MSHLTFLDKNLTIRRVAEHQPSEVQTASSTPLTIDSHPHESAQASALADICTLQTGQDQFRAMNQTPTARATDLSTIDKEVDAARRYIRSLHSRRNTLALISALPPELLVRIFYFHALEEPAWFFGPHPLGWIAVTHVCQLWRQVALHNSFLWACVSLSHFESPSAEWLAEMLVRAQNAPLVVDFMNTPSPDLLDMLPRHISHTRELRLRGLSKLHFRSVREICGSEAPELEDFELEISSPLPVNFKGIAGKTLFNGRTPKLRTLSLARVYIPWSLIPRGQLTRLEIVLHKRALVADRSRDGWNQMVDFLVNSPQLEVLAIEFCLPLILSEFSSEQPIQLPRLSRLCLGGLTSCVTTLLKRLTIPSSATLRLQCVSEPPPTHDDHLIIPVVATHFHNNTPVEFKSLRVTAYCSQRRIEVVASVSSPKSTIYDPHLIDADMDKGTGLTLSFDGRHEFNPSSQADILRQVCEILPISNLEFLSISDFDNTQFVDWYELFQRCKNVITIQASGQGTSGLLQSLAPPKPANTPSGSKGKKRKGKRDNRATQAQAGNNAGGSSRETNTVTPFPELTSLLLEHINFNAITPNSDVLGDVLIKILQRRKTDSKTPVKTLTLDRCVIRPSRVNGMRKRVEELYWDGAEGSVYSYSDLQGSDYTSDIVGTEAQLEGFPPGTAQANLVVFAPSSGAFY